MATNTEMRTAQKTTLFKLLKLQRDNQGRDVSGLFSWIVEMEAGMEQEDVAWVEKNIKKLDVQEGR